jgi:hypothetical protein
MAYDVELCDYSVTIPIDPSEPWSGSVIASEPNTAIEMMAHTSLTYMRESRLTATAALPTALHLIWHQENPVWRQRLEDASDRWDPHFSAKTASLAKYS